MREAQMPKQELLQKLGDRCGSPPTGYHRIHDVQLQLGECRLNTPARVRAGLRVRRGAK